MKERVTIASLLVMLWLVELAKHIALLQVAHQFDGTSLLPDQVILIAAIILLIVRRDLWWDRR